MQYPPGNGGPPPYGHPGPPQQGQPQQGYPQQGYPQQGYGPAMQVAPAGPAARVVFGVPLEPGERVLYFRRNSNLANRIFSVIFGIPLILLLGLGLYLIYTAFFDRKTSHYAQAITSRRLLAINGHGQPLFAIRWEEVAGLNRVTGRERLFGVRNHAGKKFLFSSDIDTLDVVITQCVQHPQSRETATEVPFLTAVS